MKINRQRKPQMRMEMTPLIDCIFQLLIFFMLSSTFLTPSIRLSLPTAAAAGPPRGQQIIITLDADGQVFLNKQPSSFEQLGDNSGHCSPNPKTGWSQFGRTSR